jgi:hypothetical protein
MQIAVNQPAHATECRHLLVEVGGHRSQVRRNALAVDGKIGEPGEQGFGKGAESGSVIGREQDAVASLDRRLDGMEPKQQVSKGREGIRTRVFPIQLVPCHLGADEHAPRVAGVGLTSGNYLRDLRLSQELRPSQVGPKTLQVLGAVAADVSDKAIGSGDNPVDVRVTAG